MTAALTRLWWRLEDVLPLAEHAMACTAQARTAAQNLAHAADGPALTWTSTSGLDLLTSNGEPGWHTSTGRPQHAEAYTWQHRAGGYGTAWRDTYHTAHLPLAADGGRPGVIDTLRAARHTGAHWLRVDIVPADGYLIAGHRIATAAHRDQLVPDGARWRRGTVTSPVVDHVDYRAWIATDYVADHGGLLARFDRSTAERLVDDLGHLHMNPSSMPGKYPLLRWDDDVVVMLHEHDSGGLGSAYTEADRIPPDADGLYPIGAYLWAWEPGEPIGWRRSAAMLRRRWQRWTSTPADSGVRPHAGNAPASTPATRNPLGLRRLIGWRPRPGERRG